MRILAVSDHVDPVLYDHYNPERWRAERIDLLISCGDLSADYLSYLVSQFDVPLFYVPGNHDGAYHAAPPEGCDSIDGKLVTWNGLRILGLGGSPWYNGGADQYSEWTMSTRIFWLRPRLWLRRGVDLVVTHTPPAFPSAGAGVPGPPTPVPADRAHRGFAAFTGLARRYHPRVWLHGHVHLLSSNAKRETRLYDTRVINVTGRYLLDIEPSA